MASIEVARSKTPLAWYLYRKYSGTSPAYNQPILGAVLPTVVTHELI